MASIQSKRGKIIEIYWNMKVHLQKRLKAEYMTKIIKIKIEKSTMT